MSDSTKGWKVKVNPDLPDDPKLLRLATMLKVDVKKLDRLEEIVALGLVMKLWCLTMRREDSGVLAGWAPEDIALACGWVGDVQPDTFVNALLNCGRNSTKKDGKGFLAQAGPDYEVYKWREWQNDPAGSRKKWRDATASRRAVGKGSPQQKTGSSGTSSGVKLLLDRMRECHITGSVQQKREHAEAWLAAGLAQKAEGLIMGEGKSKGIFWLAKALEGPTPFVGAAKSDAVAEIERKFLGEGAGK